MNEKTTATAQSGVGNDAGNGENYRDRNAQLRAEFLECTLRIRKAHRAGDKAGERKARRERDRIADTFMRANVKLGEKGVSATLPSGVPDREDYQQAAMLGMWEAFVGTSAGDVDKVGEDENGNATAITGWNPGKGAFSTLAHAHVGGRVKRTVRRSMRGYGGMSYYEWTHRPKVQELYTKMSEELGRAPSVAEVAKRGNFTEELVRVCMTRNPASLQMLLSGPDGDSGTLEDLIPAAGTTSDSVTSAEAAEQLIAEEARGAGGDMPAHQIAVLLLRNGLLERPARLRSDTAALLCIGRGMVEADEKRAAATISQLA